MVHDYNERKMAETQKKKGKKIANRKDVKRHEKMFDNFINYDVSNFRSMGDTSRGSNR